MHQVFFRIEWLNLTIYWFGVMMATAFLVGFANWVYLGKRYSPPRDFNLCADLLFWIMISGVLGARIISIAYDFDFYMAHPEQILRIDKGGLVYYGGFLGAGVAVAVFARVRKQELVSLFDFIITSLPLSHALGRIGCFLNGCCQGTACNGPLAVQYPMYSLPWDAQVQSHQITRHQPALPVHPVQLYEAAFNICLYLVLLRVYPRRKSNGLIMAIYLTSYAVGRFCFEFIRGDEVPYMLGLTTSQWTSFFILAFGITMMIYAGRHPIVNDDIQSKT